MKNTHQHIDFDLMARFFAKECSLEECESVEVWRKSAAENEEEFKRLEKIFLFDSPSFSVDTEAAMQKLNKRISLLENNKVKNLPGVEKGNKKPLWFLRVAAIFVFVLFFYIIAQKYNDSQNTIAYSAENEPKTASLSDGSLVFMNENTHLSFSENRRKNTRNIELSGEAFFEVARNEDKPFIINTEFLEIEVLGTSFNVYSVAKTDSAKVSVSSGTVKVSLKGQNEAFVLSAGESAVYLANKKSFKKITSNNQNDMFWRTGTLDFKGEKMKDVAKILSQNFGVSIIVQAESENCKINASFNNESLETILEVLATTLQLTIEKKPEGYVFQGKGC